MNEGKPVKIVISGKLNYTDDVTVTQAAQIIAFIDSSTATPLEVAALPGTTSARLIGNTAKQASNPREALDSSDAKTNPEKIVAFALYVAQDDGDKDSFTLDEIKPLFRRAREPVPKNISRDLDAAIRLGWIAEGETKGEYYVTGKASRVLEDTFDSLRGTSKTKTSPRSSTGTKKPRNTAATVPEAFSDIDTLEPSIEGVVDYHKLTKKTDKFLWAIYKAKTLGIDLLTNQEIVWLTDRLGEGIASNDINGNYRQNYKSGYVNKSIQTNKTRITPNGETYLKTLSDD